MKFSRKLLLLIIINITKEQGFILLLEDTFFKKPQGCQIEPSAILGLKLGLGF